MDDLVHSFSWWGDLAKVVAAVAAIASVGYGLYQSNKRKSNDAILLGFLHGLKPSIQSAARGDAVSPTHWQSVLDQIHDMMARLQPPKNRN